MRAMSAEEFDSDYVKIEMSDAQPISHDGSASVGINITTTSTSTTISVVIEQATKVAEQVSDILPRLGELTHVLYVGSCRLCHAIMMDATDYIEDKAPL